MLIVCPSGLSFEARRWRIEDRRVLLDRKDKRPVQRRMLEVVAGPIEDVGPYQVFERGKKPDFLKVATLDLVAALYDVRTASKPIYVYDAWCERCGAKLEMEQDLRVLPRRKPSSEAVDFLSTGQPVVRRYGEVEVGYKLPLGADLPKLEGIKEFAEQLSASVAMHIAYVQAPGGTAAVQDFAAVRKWYDSIDDWELAQQIDQDIDAIEGGLDTIITQRCTSDGCASEVSFPLPLELGFFVPSMEPRRSRLTSSGPSSNASALPSSTGTAPAR